jgi:hypothetical protein
MYQLIHDWQKLPKSTLQKSEFHTTRWGSDFLRAVSYCCVYVGDTAPTPSETVTPTSLWNERGILAQPPIVDFERSDCRLRTVRRETLQIPVAISGLRIEQTYEDTQSRRHEVGEICNHVVRKKKNTR